MEIFCIFENDKEALFTVKFEDAQFDAWEEIFENWFDIEFLVNYFQSYSNILQNEFWGNITVDEAVWKTREDAKKIQNRILSCEKGEDNLSAFFRPLNDSEIQRDNLLRTKVYGIETDWLRIYAVKLTDTQKAEISKVYDNALDQIDKKNSVIALEAIKQTTQMAAETSLKAALINAQYESLETNYEQKKQELEVANKIYAEALEDQK